MTVAFVFPGQGSQSVGMLSELARRSPIIEATFAEASQVLGFDLWGLCQMGPAEALSQTEVTQPAMLAAGVATYRLWRERGGTLPVMMAGHSLGEFSALVAGGRLDFPDDLLARLDYVVASVHHLLGQDETTMTARLIRTMENEHVTMLGHATGRRLLQREASRVNFEKIIDCAAETGTWIELNCSTSRMDMDWRWWRRARDRGVKCVINPDAHRVAAFGALRQGVTAARKGWLRREDVMNTRTRAEIERALRT